MNIRQETPLDYAPISAINRAAFETDAEARLVEALRQQAAPYISLVAERDEQLVGYIFFSPVTLDGHSELKLMGLAPMAVSASYQKRGIGGALIEAGMAACQDIGIDAVVVLGHPEYYPRFDFVPSARFGIDCEYDVPEEMFMLREIHPGTLKSKAGRVHYHPAFSAL